MCEDCSVDRSISMGDATVCGPCGAQTEREGAAPPKKAVALQALLHAHPTGHHVSLSRLMLAHCYLSSNQSFTGCKQDVSKGKSEYLALAEEGFGPALYAVGKMHIGTGMWLSPLVSHLGPESCTIPFHKNIRTGNLYLMRAAKCDHLDAIIEVAQRYKTGDYGFPKDGPKAMELFQQAANNHGSGLAMVTIARMFFRGDEGVTQNDGKAIRWYRRARDEAGWPSASLKLWEFSLHGLVPLEEGMEALKSIRESGWLDTDDFRKSWGAVMAPEMLRELRGK